MRSTTEEKNQLSEISRPAASDIHPERAYVCCSGASAASNSCTHKINKKGEQQANVIIKN
jgi:hypothetical protein